MENDRENFDKKKYPKRTTKYKYVKFDDQYASLLCAYIIFIKIKFLCFVAFFFSSHLEIKTKIMALCTV